VALACGAAACLAGCASGSASSQSTALPDRTMSAPASTSAAGDPRALARQAYLGMWQAFTAASRTADYQYPSLDHYAAGAALALLTRGLYQNHLEGIVTRGQATYDPVVTMAKTPMGTAEADITDCADDSHALAYYKSGKPAPGEPPGRQRVYAQAQPFDGTWKVTTLVVDKVGSC
jgi:hypothetical protein